MTMFDGIAGWTGSILLVKPLVHLHVCPNLGNHDANLNIRIGYTFLRQFRRVGKFSKKNRPVLSGVPAGSVISSIGRERPRLMRFPAGHRILRWLNVGGTEAARYRLTVRLVIPAGQVGFM